MSAFAIETLKEYKILMKMNLVGGHAGKSGRLNALEESALDNAFLVNLVANQTKP